MIIGTLSSAKHPLYDDRSGRLRSYAEDEIFSGQRRVVGATVHVSDYWITILGNVKFPQLSVAPISRLRDGRYGEERFDTVTHRILLRASICSQLFR